MFKKTKRGKTTNTTSTGKVVGYILLLLFVFLYVGILLGFLFGTISTVTTDPSVSWAAPALASLVCFILCFNMSTAYPGASTDTSVYFVYFSAYRRRTVLQEQICQC